MVKLAPSILSADFARLGEQINEAARAWADYIHVDVMDGHFVPNISIGAPVVAAIRPLTSLPLDVHLMIERPERFISDFVKAGADIITVHVEASPHCKSTIKAIKELGARAGVSLNPSTPLSAIEWVLTDIDMVLLMTVNPGFGGQAYLPQMTGKIELLRSQLVRSGLSVDIEVDGGIKTDNVAEVVRAGANVIVSGSGIFKTEDYGRTISEMRKNIRKAVSAPA